MFGEKPQEFDFLSPNLVFCIGFFIFFHVALIFEFLYFNFLCSFFNFYDMKIAFKRLEYCVLCLYFLQLTHNYRLIIIFADISHYYNLGCLSSDLGYFREEILSFCKNLTGSPACKNSTCMYA